MISPIARLSYSLHNAMHIGKIDACVVIPEKTKRRGFESRSNLRLDEKIKEFVLFSTVCMLILSLNLTYGQPLETYQNPTFAFKFQFPSEWKQVLNEVPIEISFSLYKLPNSEPNFSDSLAIMVMEITEDKTLRQYLNQFDSIFNVDFSSLKLNETELSGLPAMNATWYKNNDRFQMIYAMKERTVYHSIYQAESTAYKKNLPQVSDIIKSLQISD
jgi:hypothetical protein